MNVQDALGKRLEEWLTHESHVPGEADQIDAVVLQRLYDGAVVARRSAYRFGSSTTVSMPAARARWRPGACARFETTTAIVASSSPRPIASTIDWRLLPRPEIRTPS